MSDIVQLPFATILAASVHDMKNSLSMLLSSLEELIEKEKKNNNEFTSLHYQATRINSDLVKLLSLYKLEHSQYPFQPAPFSVGDFLEEQVIGMETLAENYGIEVALDCPRDLEWVADETLLSGVLNDILANAIRYTRSLIVLCAKVEDNMLKISVVDNGPGYPENFLKGASPVPQSINFDTGSTGLGLYFAENVARLHKKNDRTGVIELSNRKEGGGQFTIVLP